MTCKPSGLDHQMKVLVVDDSVVFRSQITSALATVPGIEIVGTASNGRIALQRLEQQSIDLITLDMEMPEMDGMETLKALRAKNHQVKVIVFSSQTLRGAEKALDALHAGADDVVAKPSGDSLNFETALEAVKTSLLPKVIQFIDQRMNTSRAENPKNDPQTDLNSLQTEQKHHRAPAKLNLSSLAPQIIVIASSTGGPTALETIFAKIPGPYKVPILIAQHMPPVFTQILAKRLGDLTGVQAKEAINGEAIKSNNIYVAPGDFHLRVQRVNGYFFTHIAQDNQRNSVRPAADFLFESAAETYGGKVLGVVLTGMGDDGCDGAKAIKRMTGGIIIQNKESSTVFGMPGAIFEAGAFDEIGDLDYIAQRLALILKA